MLFETIRVYKTTMNRNADPKRRELKTESWGTSAFGRYVEYPQWVIPSVNELETIYPSIWWERMPVSASAQGKDRNKLMNN